MKWVLFILLWAVMGAYWANAALAEVTYIESDGKRYTVVEIDDEMLVSNEWEPVDASGYVDRIKAIKESIK